MDQYLGQVVMAIGFILAILGLYGLLSQKNMIKMILGFSIFTTGVNIIMVAIGYVKGGTAPILDAEGNAVAKFVDPVPQALVLTSIVIGLGVTAMMLAYVMKLYQDKKSLNINDYKDLKW
ncbi:MAG: NADH-quinone oxidoreductase subunit K [Ichthyobacteriaceae bacterium]|nr:NADH-quinone oxidoreductase subunit K [Ichthyobacteriaceae bacterium]